MNNYNEFKIIEAKSYAELERNVNGILRDRKATSFDIDISPKDRTRYCVDYEAVLCYHSALLDEAEDHN